MSKYSSPRKSETFYLSLSSISPKKLTESELKELEIQALALLDSDIGQSKQIIENCLRLYDESSISLLENV
jgi:hypothetical protein